MPSINIRTQCLCAFESVMEKFESKPKQQQQPQQEQVHRVGSSEDTKLRPMLTPIGDGLGRACP